MNGMDSADRRNNRARFTVLDAPSILGLRPTGVELLPSALRAAGLLQALSAADAGSVRTPASSGVRDPNTHVINADGIREFSIRLAGAISEILVEGQFPLVLGGDCSIVIGAMLALRR